MSKTLRIAVQPGDAYLVPGDMHYPHQHDRAIAAMTEWWQTRQQAGFWLRTGVIFQGDTIDPYGLSRFKKRAKKYWDAGKVMTAVDAATPFIEWAAGSHELGATLLPGNHEDWIRQATDEQPAFEGCPGIEFAALTGLNAIDGLEVLNVGDRILLGDKCVIVHGHDLPKTPETVMRKYPDQFTVHGHDHKVYKLHRTVYDAAGEPGIRGVASVGMLAGRKATEDYAPDPDMQLGFAVIEFYGKRSNGLPFFRVDEHVIVEDGGQCVVC